MRNWWQTLSVSKKLYGVVGVMALLIATELGTLYFAMSTLSAVRAFVGGEGLWSKAQKTAVYNLQLYANSPDEKYYRMFENHLKVSQGDRKARLALEQPEVDMRAVTEGFLEGQNHLSDIPPMVKLVRRFHQVPHLARAIDEWRTGDLLISELMTLADQLHQEVIKGPKSDANRIASIMQQVSRLDDRLTVVENRFSFRLGEASRWLERILMIVLVLAVVTVESTGLLLTISFGRGLTKVLTELNEAAIRVGEGDFDQKVPIRSRDELGQLAESLNSMISNLRRQTSGRENAEHASEAKNLFLANMSHEIRTPLNAILGFSELLADPTISEAERSNYASIIKRTGASLTTIINDILDISKVEAKQVEVESNVFSLPQLMSDLHTLLRMRCEEKGIDLIFEKRGEIADFIQSDPSRLRQILANIVGNSIKFTSSGSVTVTYEVSAPHLVFTVRDTGGGIPVEQVDRLFKPFSQGDDSVQKKYGGTGLGLMISQRLAQLLGGNVGLLENRPPIGCAFFIKIRYLPADRFARDLEKAPDAARAQGSLPLHGKRILVVEDSKDNQLLANLYLTRAGATVQFANDGRAGVDLAMKETFDVILMDIQMPVMDGYSATQEIRKRGSHTPIVALTGYAMKEDQEKCLRAGCNAYLSKPFDRVQLISCVLKYA